MIPFPSEGVRPLRVERDNRIGFDSLVHTAHF